MIFLLVIFFLRWISLFLSSYDISFQFATFEERHIWLSSDAAAAVRVDSQPFKCMSVCSLLSDQGLVEGGRAFKRHCGNDNFNLFFDVRCSDVMVILSAKKPVKSVADIFICNAILPHTVRCCGTIANNAYILPPKLLHPVA